MKRDVLASLAPEGVALGVCEIGAQAIGLFAEEQAAVVRAVAVRQREFAAGRRAARRALKALGAPQVALPAAPDRTPVWPPGFVGSISHTEGFAAAVAASSSQFRGLGLDVETIARVTPEIERRIVRPEERRRLDDFASRQTGLALFFCAKEAWYKAQYPITRTFFGFEDVEAQFDLAASRFEVRPVVERGAPALGGRFVIDEGIVACLATWMHG